MERKILLKLFFIFPFFLALTLPVKAQELNISVSPPITEVMIMPGKEIIQTYQLTNYGDDKLLSVHIVPFFPNINNPIQIDLIEEEDIAVSKAYAGWFTIVKPYLSFGQKMSFLGNSNQDMTIKISPPKNALQKDYYFTILFESEGSGEGFIGNTTSSKARIGSNLLLTVSENGKPFKDARITEFSAPLLIDSLAKINYKLVVENTGRAFAKPIGKIIIEEKIFKKTYKVLNLAPLNILTSSSREIICLAGEETVACEAKPGFLGIYKATVRFNLDGEGQNYSTETITFVFPFSIIITFMAVFLILKTIQKFTKNPKNESSP